MSATVQQYVLQCTNIAGLSPGEEFRCRFRGSRNAEVAATFDEVSRCFTCHAEPGLSEVELIAADGKVLCASDGGDCGCQPGGLKAVGALEVEPAQDGATAAPGVWQQMSFVDRYLAIWVILAMVLGVLLSEFAPGAKKAFSGVKADTVSLPLAIGLWGMMYPVLCKVRYEIMGTILRERSLWKQFTLSFILNWVVGPILMVGLAWATLPDLDGYRNGVILVGLARCIAMVLLWNQLAHGHAEFCAMLVAMNSFMQIILYAPMAVFYLKVVSHQYQGDASVTFSFWDVAKSVLIFLGIPLVLGIATRMLLLRTAGLQWYNKRFVPVVGPLALVSLLYTIVVLFLLQGKEVLDHIGSVVRVAVPLALYFGIMWTATGFICRKVGFTFAQSVTQAFTASSNNFELAIAVAVGTFGSQSPEALAATVGPLIEVPVLLALVYVALWFERRW